MEKQKFIIEIEANQKLLCKEVKYFLQEGVDRVNCLYDPDDENVEYIDYLDSIKVKKVNIHKENK